MPLLSERQNYMDQKVTLAHQQSQFHLDFTSPPSECLVEVIKRRNSIISKHPEEDKEDLMHV